MESAKTAQQVNMYKFKNYYRCEKCNTAWDDFWKSPHNGDCPKCGHKNIKPVLSSQV